MQYQRRTEGVLAHALDDEVVVYDAANDHAHLLDPPTAAVWRALGDGPTSLAALRDAVVLDRSVVELALAELGRVGLLEPSPDERRAPGLSRRQLLRVMGIAAVSAPAIITLSAPPVAALAVCGQECGTPEGDPIPSVCVNSLNTCECQQDQDPSNLTGWRCVSIG
jgi:hypothetical protein